MAKLQSRTKIKQLLNNHIWHMIWLSHISALLPKCTPQGSLRHSSGGAPPHPPEESKWLQNQKSRPRDDGSITGRQKKRWQHCEVQGYDRDTDLKLERKSKSKKLVLVVSPTKLIVMDELDLEGMVRIFIFNLFNMGFFHKTNGIQRPSSSISQGPPNNESKESGTCSNLRGEGSRPVVSHLRKNVPMLHAKFLDSTRFCYAKSYEHESWAFFGGPKQWPKVKINSQKGHVNPPSYSPSDTKMDDSKICQFGWLQPSINSWAELPPRGQHALCSSGGTSQGTPGQMHDLHQFQLKSCTAISGVTHVFCHSEGVLVWMHTIEMGVHLIDTNSMVEFNLPLGSDQWHQNFGRTCAPHQAQIPSLQKIARKDQRQEKDKSREAVCILFIKRKCIGKWIKFIQFWSSFRHFVATKGNRKALPFRHQSFSFLLQLRCLFLLSILWHFLCAGTQPGSRMSGDSWDCGFFVGNSGYHWLHCEKSPASKWATRHWNGMLHNDLLLWSKFVIQIIEFTLHFHLEKNLWSRNAKAKHQNRGVATLGVWSPPCLFSSSDQPSKGLSLGRNFQYIFVDMISMDSRL